jgi:hypothetical protein
MGNADNNILSGVPGDEIGDGTNLVIQGSKGAGNANSEDKIAPLSGADSVFTYTTVLGPGAIKYDSGVFKVVYFSFPYEAIHGTGPFASRETVMERIIAWLDSTLVGVEESKDEYRTRNYEFRLLQNKPNPFNQLSVVSFQLSVPAYTTLKIYDISGRLVKTLIDEHQKPGLYQLPITSNQLPSSGIYFYRLQLGNMTATKKMILLR